MDGVNVEGLSLTLANATDPVLPAEVSYFTLFAESVVLSTLPSLASPLPSEFLNAKLPNAFANECADVTDSWSFVFVERSIEISEPEDFRFTTI